MLWELISFVKTRQFALIVIANILWRSCDGKKANCLSIPTLPAKVNYFIRSCQSEIKSNIIDDLVYATLNDKSHFKNTNHYDLLVKHVEYLSRHHHPQHNPLHNHLDGYEYFHDAHSQEIPKFANPFSFHHYATNNAFDFQDIVVDPTYSAYLEGRFKIDYPEAVEHVISQQPQRIREEKVIQAHEELMNILSSHKVVKRDLDSQLKKNFTTIFNPMKNIEEKHDIKRRSLINMLNLNRLNQKPLAPLVIPTAPGPPLHPILLSSEDRWLAGCLMQCIFHKTNSLDKYGYPTLDGLVDLYTTGTNDQRYFIFTLRAVNKCLKLISIRHHVHKGKYPHKTETCDIAFDVFDCISDSIAFYCNSF